MDNNLKNKVAKYVDKVGVEHATTKAVSYIESFTSNIKDGYEYSDNVMANIKFYSAVMEYLYCDSERVKVFLKEVVL